MARLINGTLLVPAYTPTANPGEYTFTGATYANAADATGNGAADLNNTFLLFVPAADPNTFEPVPGTMHRYKFTALNVVNQNTIGGTILWDEGGSEVDKPLDGARAIISEKGAGRGLGYPVSTAVYPALGGGADIGTIAVEERVKIDPPSVPSGPAGGDLSGTYPNPTVAKANGVTLSGVPSSGQVLTATGAAAASWQAPVGGAPSGPAGGDLGGAYPNPAVAKVNGVSVTGTPTSGQVITATGATAATWQTPSGGGGGYSATHVVAAPTGVAATDTANLQAAITAVASGGTILLREGTYLINASLTISAANVTIRGQGRAATVIKADSSGPLSGSSTMMQAVGNNTVLMDLTIDASGAARGANNSSNDLSVFDGSLVNVQFKDPYALNQSAVLVNNATLRTGRIEGCLFALGGQPCKLQFLSVSITSNTFSTSVASSDVISLSSCRFIGNEIITAISAGVGAGSIITIPNGTDAQIADNRFRHTGAGSFTHAVAVVFVGSNENRVTITGNISDSVNVGDIIDLDPGNFYDFKALVIASMNSGFSGYSGPRLLSIANDGATALIVLPPPNRNINETTAATADTAVIQAALTAAATVPNVAAGVGSTVRLRGGRYLISSTLTLGAGVRLIGAGTEATILKAHTTLSASSSLVSCPNTRSEIRDLTLDIGGTGNGQRGGALTSVSDIVISGSNVIFDSVKTMKPTGHTTTSIYHVSITVGAESDAAMFRNCQFQIDSTDMSTYINLTHASFSNCLFRAEQSAFIMIGAASAGFSLGVDNCSFIYSDAADGSSRCINIVVGGGQATISNNRWTVLAGTLAAAVFAGAGSETSLVTETGNTSKNTSAGALYGQTKAAVTGNSGFSAYNVTGGSSTGNIVG